MPSDMTVSDFKDFDPTGAGYDYLTAREFGLGPKPSGENKGHWPSVVGVPEEERERLNLGSEAYLVLKGRDHATWDLAESAEEERGFQIVEKDGRFYSVKKPPPQPDIKNIRRELLRGVEIRDLVPGYGRGHSETLVGDDSPTGMPMIMIGDAYQGAARDKMIAAESLHLLKHADKARWQRLYDTAMADPKYTEWARRSYDVARGLAPDEDGNYNTEHPEKRDFDRWHTLSRFDQVLGGYIYAGDSDLPTMKNWDRERLPIGEAFRAELESFRKDFETPMIADPEGQY